MTSIIDGKAIAKDIYRELTGEIASLGRELRLGIIVVGHDPVIESFVRIKLRAAKRLGVAVIRRDLPGASSTEKVTHATRELSDETDAVIVQLPLPAGRQGFPGVDTEAVLAAIPPEKDVDAINPTIPEDRRPVHAPVALAVMEILARSGIEVEGKRAVVVGAGRLVGAPAAALLRSFGAHVSVVRRSQGSIEDLKDANIVVLGVGKPGFIKPEMLKEGVALIDGGTSESSGKVVGDADPACADVASVFTPVPGGVGPVAVAMIYRNLLSLAHRDSGGI